MNNVWKRALSLALSGVLLVGSLPLNALATEETVPSTEPAVVETQPVQLAAETQPVQTEPAQTEPVQTEPPATEPPATEATQPAATEATQPAAVPQETVSMGATDSVKAEQVGGKPVTINGLVIESLTDEALKAAVKYEAGKLKLNGAKIKATGEYQGIKTTVPLEIVLEGKNTIEADAEAIFAEADLTISGNGSLVVTSKNAIAVYVAGVEDTANNVKKGLTIKDVQLSVETNFSETEKRVGIASEKGVAIKGNAHFKTNATKNGEKYVMEKAGYINGEARTANADFNGGTALEYYADEHFDAGTWRSDDNKHYKSCKGECVIAVRRDEGSHTGGTADCMNKAVCSECGLAYGEVDYKNHTEHTAADTKYIYIEEKHEHLLVHTDCEHAEPGATATHCTLDYTCEDGSSEIICACNTEGCPNSMAVFTVAAPAAAALVWDNTNKKATVDWDYEPDPDYTLTYYKDAVAEENKLGEGVFPKDPGTYIAVAEVEIEGEENTFAPQAKMIITAAQIQGMTVSLDKEKAVFEGLNMNVQAPTVTVQHESQTLTKDTHYTVEYHTAEGQVANLSEIGTYTIKIIGKAPYVTGTVEKQFRIVKKPVSADDFTFAPPAMPEGSSELVYDGTAKTASVTHSDIPADKITVKYFKGTEQITQPVDAGDYTVTISVAETNDYAATETDLSSPNWKFTIKKAGYTIEAPQSPQKLALKNARFTEPNVKGVGTDDVGEFKYTINYLEGANGISYESAVAKLASISQEPQNGVEIKYTFQRQDENYNDNTDQNTGSFVVELSEVKFYVGEDVATAENAVTKNKENIFVGDTDLFTLKTITAKHGNDQKTEAFSIKLEPETPVVGNGNAYVVLFTGTVDGIVCKDMEVCRGTFEVKEAPPVYTAPTAKKVPAGEDKQDLVQAGTTDRGTIRYSRNNTEWKTTIPQEKDAGAYWVYWQIVDANDNTKVLVEGGKLTAVIYPVLTATYGDLRSSLTAKLPVGFSLTEPGDANATVGDAGERTIKLNYTHPDDADKTDENYTHASLSGEDIPLTVNRKEVKIQVSLPETHYKLVVTASGVGLQKTITPVVKHYKTETELVELPSSEYNVSRSLTNYPGIGEVSVTSKSINYDFQESSDTTEPYTIYRPGAYELSIVPETLEYENVEKLEEALKKVLEKKHADDDMAFYNLKMQEYNETTKKWEPTTEEFYCPAAGFTHTLAYPSGENEKTQFELVGINTMENATSRSVEKIDFKLKSTGIEFQMKNYAAVCLAWDGYNETDTYKVTTSATNGKVQFTIGTDTTQKTKDDAVKVGEKLTITATPNSNYALTKIQYIYKEGTTSKAKDIKQNDDGKYVLEMPPMDITIKATFSKKASSTKNPYSGDSSNIQLWVTILAASAVAIAALMVFWFRKRRK